MERTDFTFSGEMDPHVGVKSGRVKERRKEQEGETTKANGQAYQGWLVEFSSRMYCTFFCVGDSSDVNPTFCPLTSCFLFFFGTWIFFYIIQSRKASCTVPRIGPLLCREMMRIEEKRTRNSLREHQTTYR